ncbi:TPA: hypothetical protein NQS24_002238 [Klebsiella pneumoniae]|nr:hypothetical protein [Klebsiella pneumoniae]HDH0755981.1 hypothetical protein [Klebsiella pneumoniae]
MQHVTIKSSHFHAWTSHLLGTVIGGAVTGVMIGFLLGWASGDTGIDLHQDMGLTGFAGVGVYVACFLLYTLVRAALTMGHE